MNDDHALPAHYREAGKEADEDDRPTPGIEASEHADPHLRADMNRINEHWRWRREKKRR